MEDRIAPLDQTHDRAAFSCGKRGIDNYFHRHALQAQLRHFAATFVAVNASEPQRVLGFYTLIAIEFRDDEMPDVVARKLKVKGMGSIPGILLAQFATLESMQGRGLGRLLLTSALEKCLEASNNVGAVAVVADPIDQEAEGFYRKFDFVSLDPESPRLVLAMKTIAQACSPRR